ncbi:MAG: penicillin-binding protein 2 [Phycisphaerae bacterium]|nr:penicillin-binding protein 2 [Phycisphaerae bacterium]
MIMLMAVFGLLGWRCIHLQYIEHDRFNFESTKQLQRIEEQKPQRGTIVDCRGKILAASNRINTIFVDPSIIEDKKDVSCQLGDILDTGAHIICQDITKPGVNPRYVKIRENATDDQCIKASRVYGVGVETKWQRSYPAGRLAAHIVGFSSKDNFGLEGIELQYEDQLKGTPGESVFYVDAARRPIRFKEQKTKPVDGKGLILTIDSTIQQFVYTELYNRYTEYQAESAIAIVAEPKTGAILACVSLPDFDPQKPGASPPDTWRNRAITDQFEPGSLMKPFVVAIALDNGIVNKTEKIYCEKGSYHGKGFGRIGEYGNHSYGNLTVKEILIHSSNIGMAKIGQRLKRQTLYDGLWMFGFSKPTGIDIPGETTGMLRTVDKWTGYSETRIPYGQEITVTAMQLVRAFCILANGGKVVEPYLVKATVDDEGNVEKLKRPGSSIGYILKPEVADWVVKDALVAVVNEGTGSRAKLEKWQLFGKTGTANIAKSDSRGYSETDWVASFIAGAPAENPRVVVLVSIRKPNRKLGKGYTGGTVASPVAAKIIEKTLNYLENRGQ